MGKPAQAMKINKSIKNPCHMTSEEKENMRLDGAGSYFLNELQALPFHTILPEQVRACACVCNTF